MKKGPSKCCRYPPPSIKDMLHIIRLCVMPVYLKKYSSTCVIKSSKVGGRKDKSRQKLRSVDGHPREQRIRLGLAGQEGDRPSDCVAWGLWVVRCTAGLGRIE
jgi:hypothetical protein